MAENRSGALGSIESTIAQHLVHEPLLEVPVLVVEDEPLVGHVLHVLLLDHGYRPIGPARTLAAAKEAIAENALGAALLDIRLEGNERSFELAEILAALRIPFAFLSSYSPALIPRQFRDVPLLSKPFSSADVLTLLARLLGDPPKSENESLGTVARKS